MERLVILGSGCAGYTAAVYAARSGLSPLLISGKDEGGQLMLTTEVENFPGFPDGVQGPKLVESMKKQARKFGARLKRAFAKEFNILDNGLLEIATGDEKIQTIALIIATGASARWLGILSEQEYKGRGIHTCAICDAYFYKDKEVIIVGGGDSACEEANFLTKHASKVTIVHRRDTLRASKIVQDRAKNNPKIFFIWDSIIEQVKGDGKKVSSVMLKNVKSGEVNEMNIDGVFLAIGHIPNTKIFESKINLDDHGFIVTDERLRTNIKGVFAAGDVQDPIYKQAITAAGTGCQAAIEAGKYIEEWEDKNN